MTAKSAYMTVPVALALVPSLSSTSPCPGSHPTLGLDKLDMSYRELLAIPLELYKGAAAQDKLNNLVWVDFSNNKITKLPGKHF